MTGIVPPHPQDEARLDKWLWQARFFKSRTLAAELCRSGRVRLNGTHVTKPSATVGPGDILTFPYHQQVRILKIMALATRRGPASEARLLYEELSTAEVREKA